MTHDDLVRYRSGYASCELVALVDISAGTVLMSDSAVPQGQERLDQLGAQAKMLFSGALPTSRQAVLAAPTGSRLFLQSPRDPAEVLCGLFGPTADLADASEKGAQLIALDTGE